MKAHMASVMVALLCGCAAAHAQSVDQLEADIPFSFHAGMVTFPAGKYGFQLTEVAGTSTMEARSADGLYTALMEIRNSKAVPRLRRRISYSLERMATMCSSTYLPAASSMDRLL